ncbi:MAG: DUF1295 domain-containing protein [Paludibacteraceae bacterium]|nr:DUF1295 domain-containing protein [Paludibacteraceae bacterium]
MLVTFIILTLLTMAIDAVGFKRFIWFISIGYGYSVAGIALAVAIIHFHSLTWATGLMLLLLMFYGCRLATYLLFRELRNKNYTKTVSLDAKNNTDYKPMVLVAIWLSCVLLYLCQTSPIIFRVQNAADGLSDNMITAWIGVAIAAFGIVMEAWADHQKNVAKKINPNRFVDTGLYRIVRCPNYLGEVLLWTGVFVCGIGAYHTWWQWLMALLGYIGIIYIMFSGARRLELRQDHNYGTDEAYLRYKKSTPILLPFVPIYSVKNQTWLVG